MNIKSIPANVSTKKRAAILKAISKMRIHEIEKIKEQEIKNIHQKYSGELYGLNSDIEALECLRQYGWIYASVWSRDCDMCESTSVFKTQSLKKYNKRILDAYEWAEGPMSFSIITKEEYDAFKKPGNRLGRTRDRIMEAYENGNGTSIYV
jgi:hypothetical protein